MNSIIAISLLIIGFIVIIKSGDILVDCALNISRITGISEAVIGATVISLATTLPEILVSLFASIGGSSEMAVGNGIGSVLCNTALILGISFVSTRSVVPRKDFLIKAIMFSISVVGLFIFCLDGNISIIDAIVLLVIFSLFFIQNISQAKKEKTNTFVKHNEKLTKHFILFFISAIGIAIGARLLVDNAHRLAHLFNINEEIIGITILAFGTSLPELITSLTAIKRNCGSLALGNIIGANTINCTLLISLSCFGANGNLIVNQSTKFITIPLCILINLIVIIPTAIKQKTFKTQGILMLCTYFAYFLYLILFLKN